MKTKPFSLRIHMGAGIDLVTFNGHAFDRRKMDREGRRQLRVSVVRAFSDSQPKQKATA
jgi:hypothetical protein